MFWGRKMINFPLTVDWNKKERDLPDLNLQILETYLSKGKEITSTQIQGLPKKQKTQVKRLKVTTIMRYLDGKESSKQAQEERDEKRLEEELRNWKNLLIWGDNLYILKSMIPRFQNSLQFVYIDPPFYTGANEIIDIPIGTARGATKPVKQMPSSIKDIAYRNIWSKKNPILSFCQWFYERARLISRLLKPEGFIAVRFDYHYGHYAKIVLDHIFKESNFLIELLVRRILKTVSKKAMYNQKHFIVQNDSLFLYRKSPKAELPGNYKKTKRNNADSIEYESNRDNIWIDIAGYEKKKKTLYPTENSEKLLERIINLCSKPKEIVADFFCGSGTTVAVAQKLNRRWIGVDLSRYSINEIRKRILEISDSAQYPFQLLNLEMYNKHLLYLKLKSKDSIRKIQQNYYSFILNSFGGTTMDLDHIQGKNNNALIHIGSIDSIISPKEIQKAIEEAKSKNYKKLIILGWDYFMEVGFFKKILQEEQNIDVDLRIIPQKLLTDDDQENLSFPKLPFLEFKQNINPKTRSVNIQFENFTSEYHTNLYNIEMDNINPLDLIDFWAIDWDYNENILFQADSYSYRKIGTGRSIAKSVERTISHSYSQPGNYTVVLTVVDIFGNETSEYFQLVFI